MYEYLDSDERESAHWFNLLVSLSEHVHFALCTRHACTIAVAACVTSTYSSQADDSFVNTVCPNILLYSHQNLDKSYSCMLLYFAVGHVLRVGSRGLRLSNLWLKSILDSGA